MPEGRTARVRAIEVHGNRLDSAAAGQRVAVNLRGIGLDEVRRGDALATMESEAHATHRLDVELGAGGEAILAERRVQVHLGTRETPARVVDRKNRAVQLRLQRPLIARRGDRLVIRRIAPPDTIGGGLVLDPCPPRVRRDGRGEPPPGSRAPAREAERQAPGPLARAAAR